MESDEHKLITFFLVHFLNLRRKKIFTAKIVSTILQCNAACVGSFFYLFFFAFDLSAKWKNEMKFMRNFVCVSRFFALSMFLHSTQPEPYVCQVFVTFVFSSSFCFSYVLQTCSVTAFVVVVFVDVVCCLFRTPKIRYTHTHSHISLYKTNRLLRDCSSF